MASKQKRLFILKTCDFMKSVVLSATGNVTCLNKHILHGQFWPPSVISALEKVFM